jgi:hypothetical protein
VLTLEDLVVKRLMTGTLEVNPYTQEGRSGEVGPPKQGARPVPLFVKTRRVLNVVFGYYFQKSYTGKLAFYYGLQQKNRKNITGLFMDADGRDNGVPGGGGGQLREVENEAKVSRPQKDPKIIRRRVCVSCWKLVREGMLWLQLTVYIYESIHVHITVNFVLFADFLPVYSFADFFTLSQRFLLIKKKSIKYVQAGLKLTKLWTK